MSQALSLGLLSAILATGCSDVVVDPEPEKQGPFAIAVHVGTVLHEGQSWATTPVTIGVRVYEFSCFGCGPRISTASVRGGPAGQLTDLPWSEVVQGYEGPAPAGVPYAVEVTVDGETVAIDIPRLSAHDVTISPDPPVANQNLLVEWSATNIPEGAYAGVGLTSPDASALYPPSGVGPDDGNELIPGSAFAASGSYELRMNRGLGTEQEMDGHRVTVSSNLQVNLERTIP